MSLTARSGCLDRTTTPRLSCSDVVSGRYPSDLCMNLIQCQIGMSSSSICGEHAKQITFGILAGRHHADYLALVWCTLGALLHCVM